jgi:membrane protein
LSLKILPFAMMWGLLTFVYIFMPNGQVNLVAGFLGGIVAGTLYQFWQFVYIAFQVGVSKYGAIYGSFAALPLFLVWLQVSWFIVLFGAEISFAEQNVETYEREPDCLNVSYSFKHQLSLVVVALCVGRFRDRLNPPDEMDIAHELEMPIRLIREVLRDLEKAGVIREVKIEEHDKKRYYQPAVDINVLSIKTVLDMLDRAGCDQLEMIPGREWSAIKTVMDDFSLMVEHSPKNILLKDL